MLRRVRGPAPDYKPTSEHVVRLRRPFPANLAAFVRDTYGPGVYAVAQKGVDSRYIGSTTVRVTETNGLDTGAEPASSAAAPPPPAALGGGDWKAQLIVTVGALLTTILTLAFTQRRETAPVRTERSPFSELKELLEVTQLSTKERAEIFTEGMKVARDAMEAQPGSSGGTDVGAVVQAVAEGVTEVARAVLAARQPAAVQPAHAQPAQLAPPATAADPQSQDRAFLEQLIVREIDRAMRAGDPPDTLAMILQAWLDPISLNWILNTDVEQVLAELPGRFPSHRELFSREPVVTFLRSTLQLLRSDDGEHSGGDGLPAPDTAESPPS